MKKSINLFLAIIMIALVGTSPASVSTDFAKQPKTSIVSAPDAEVVIPNGIPIKTSIPIIHRL